MAEKTVRQALIDEIHYPLSVGFVENKLKARGLTPDAEITTDILVSKAFIGATADSLISLIEAPSISEAGKSVSLGDRNAILKRANRLYASIGENEKTVDEPKVTFGNPFVRKYHGCS